MTKAPYTRLKRIAQEYIVEHRFPRTRTMFVFPKADLGGSWTLDDVAERVQAADQLGYDVRLVVTDGDLVIKYVKRAGDLPGELR